MVTEEDFIEAHRELVPSVSADELKHYERVRKAFEGAGKKEEQNGRPVQNGSARTASWKGKGKAAVQADDEEPRVVRTENIDINGVGGDSGGGSGRGSVKGKGKGKAPAASHASKNSFDIAEGGFGDAAQGDDDLYA